jgi:predicted GIY-YIG superfamily endonuclease
MVASRPYGTLYIGQTDSLRKRLFEHREKIRRGFTAKYSVIRLVWFESFELRENARRRERQLKEWRRKWKIELIEAMNPRLDDLYEDIQQPAAVLAAAWVPAFAGTTGYY